MEKEESARVRKKNKEKREKTKSLSHARRMSALFDFNAFLTVVLLTICTCAYVKMRAPGVLSERTG